MKNEKFHLPMTTSALCIGRGDMISLRPDEMVHAKFFNVLFGLAARQNNTACSMPFVDIAL